jgi:hypothetical protein
MDTYDYFWKTKKRPHKTKPRTKPLPKAKEKYLEAEEDFEHALNVLGIKYEKKFQFKSTKHWRFDFHLIEHRILVEISGGPWSGGRKGKLANKAWSMDRYDIATDMGYLSTILLAMTWKCFLAKPNVGVQTNLLSGFWKSPRMRRLYLKRVWQRVVGTV